MYLRVRSGASSCVGSEWGFAVVRALHTKSRDSVPATNSVGLKFGFFAVLACRIFSSSFADTVDLMVLETGISMLSATRLPLPLVFMLSMDGVVEDAEDELLEEDEDEEDEVEESESESESIGCPCMLPVGEVDVV